MTAVTLKCDAVLNNNIGTNNELFLGENSNFKIHKSSKFYTWFFTFFSSPKKCSWVADVTPKFDLIMAIEHKNISKSNPGPKYTVFAGIVVF